MSDEALLPGGASPPDDVVRLLRLLTRRGARLELSQAGAQYARIERSGDCLGIVPVDVCKCAAEAGLIDTRQGYATLSAQGRAVVQAWREQHAGDPGAGGKTAMETRPEAAAEPRERAEPPSRPSDRPGFDADESPLAWLARRRDKEGRPLIAQVEYDAGERFRADFWLAGMSPRVTANWSPDAGSGRGRSGGSAVAAEMRDNVVAAQERVRRALGAVGPELTGVLIDVCGHLKGLEQAERGAGWPARSGKIILQLALSSLARHYGMKPSTSKAHVRHWGAEGYRPAVDGGGASDAGAS